jgi:hypothetical protein
VLRRLSAALSAAAAPATTTRFEFFSGGKASGGTLRLLPAGELRVEKVRSLTVSGAAGKRTVARYAARGVFFAPVFVWLDADGALFSDVGDSEPPFGTIREGYAAEAPRLAAALKREVERHREDVRVGEG